MCQEENIFQLYGMSMCVCALGGVCVNGVQLYGMSTLCWEGCVLGGCVVCVYGMSTCVLGGECVCVGRGVCVWNEHVCVGRGVCLEGVCM